MLIVIDKEGRFLVLTREVVLAAGTLHEIELVVVLLVGGLFLVGVGVRRGGGLLGLWEHFGQLADEDLVVHHVVDLLVDPVVLHEVG